MSGQTSGDATPRPRLAAPKIKIFSKAGLPLFVARVGWRYFVTGREITGPGDNATFLHDATIDRGYPLVRPYQVLTRARWRRVLRRNLTIGVPAGLLSMEALADVVEAPYRLFDAAPPGWTEVPWFDMLQGYAVSGPLAAGIIVVPKLKRTWDTREVRREVIYPATKVACKITGERWNRRTALTMLQLPPGYGGEPDEDGEQPTVRLYLPAVPLDATIKKRIISSVGARVGLPDAQAEWREFGGKAWVQLTGADVPPRQIELTSTVKIEDDVATTLREAILNSTMERPVIGVASGGRIVRADFDNDSPHLAASGGTGTGKSTLFRELMIQRLRNGSGLLVLDVKGISHTWIYRLGPTRAVSVYKIEDIHNAAVALGEELYRRREEAVQAAKAGLPMPEFRVLDCLVEEANSLIPMLNAYWTARRKEIQIENKALLEDDPYADVTEPPVRSPAVDALGFGIQMGRELRIHMHYSGQRLSVSAFGGSGGDRRASFQTRILAKWDRASWRMLVSDVPYRVCPTGPRGIWCVVQGDTATMIRVPYLSMDNAVSMVKDSPDPGTPVLPTLSGHGQQGRTIEGETVRTADRLDNYRGRTVPLSAAADTIGLSVEALRSARKQDATFPAPVQRGGPGRPDLYDMAALIEWREGRNGRPLELG